MPYVTLLQCSLGRSNEIDLTVVRILLDISLSTVKEYTGNTPTIFFNNTKQM